MPDIHFECPKCKQTLDAPEEMATQLIDCPTCKEVIEVPVCSQRKEAPTPQMPAPVFTPRPTPPPPFTPKSPPISSGITYGQGMDYRHLGFDFFPAFFSFSASTSSAAVGVSDSVHPRFVIR